MSDGFRGIEAIITGKVQGVFYRQTAQRNADRLHLSGWVKNAEDGSVVLQARGASSDINAFIDWLWVGPVKAVVTNVYWSELSDEASSALDRDAGFEIIK